MKRERDEPIVSMTPAETRAFLKVAEIRVTEYEDTSGWFTKPTKLTRAEIFQGGKWKSLCRTDLHDDVCTTYCVHQSETEYREQYLARVLQGARIDEERFAVIDAYTDG